MKKLTIISYSAFLLILIIFTIFFRSLYFNQVEHFKKLLDRQVIIVGSEVDNTSMYIVSDLVEFDFSEDVALFFSDQNVGDRAKEKIKLYYSKYEDLVISVMLYNNTGDVYTLFKDEEKNTWLDGSYKAQLQPEIFDHERLEAERDKYKYYLPIIDDGQVIANFVITVDLMKYFSRVFTKYNLEDYQWQWIVNDTGAVVFDNHIGTVGYSQLSKISDQVSQGISGRISHDMITGKVKKEVMSSFYPVNILGKDFGIVFSAPTDFFRKYIIRNSLFLGLGILSIVFFLIWYFRRIYLKESLQAKETGDSVSALMDIIDQMPVGVIVYNDNREIVNANKHAASLFSYVDEEEMVGKLVPELSGNE